MEIETLSNVDLTERLKFFVENERGCLADVLEHMREFDRRRLAQEYGYGSLFNYCTKILGYSEEAAYGRIAAARAAANFPSILTRLREGRISLTAVMRLAPHLTSVNYRALLDWARGKTRRQIDEKISSLAPQDKPAQADVIRPLGPRHQILDRGMDSPSLFDRPLPAGEGDLGTGTPAPASAPETSHPAIERRQGQAIRFAFTGTGELLVKIDRARQILRHKLPAGRLEDIINEALEALLERKDPERRLRRKKALRRVLSWRQASENGRRIPQWVKDDVWERDGGRCAYIAKDGVRCMEIQSLEYDHIVPFALGGPSHDPRNIRLLCRGHNQHLAKKIFGDSIGRILPR